MINLLEPPRARPKYPGQLLFALTQANLPFLQGLAADLGPIVHMHLGPEHIYLINEPEDIREVLVVQNEKFGRARGLDRTKLLLGNGILTSEGDFHRNQRRVVQPAFAKQALLSQASEIAPVVGSITANWRDGELRNIHEEMMQLTLRIAGKILFSTDTRPFEKRLGQALEISLESFKYALLPFSEVIQNLPLPHVLRFKRAKRELDEIIYQMIEDHRRRLRDSSGPPRDVIDMLLMVQDQRKISDEQIRDEVLTLLLAGHETTANALTWTLFLLAENPRCRYRLLKEVDQILGTEPLSPTHFDGLKYTYRVLAESMRLFPPAYMMGRRALVPAQLPHVSIPEGGTVLMSQYIVHRSERFYEEPERFDPSRWESEKVAARPRFAYFPFGAGPRQCIGEQMAWLEGVLVLAGICRDWKMERALEDPIQLNPAVTLRPRNGMWMKLHRR